MEQGNEGDEIILFALRQIEWYAWHFIFLPQEPYLPAALVTLPSDSSVRLSFVAATFPPTSAP